MTAGLLLHDLPTDSGVEVPPQALVIILFAAGAGQEQALAFARQWQPAVPQAAFVGIELNDVVRQPDIAALGRGIAAVAALRSIQLSQIILLGAGDAGRRALDLVLHGAVPGRGVIGLDISLDPAPSRIERTAAMVRLVQHRSGAHAPAGFYALVEAMQRKDIDVRAMVLPDTVQAASGVTLRAGGTFLAELVANASRLPFATWR
jgi:hypothetical protein